MLSTALGTIHAFSLFIDSFEAELNVDRTLVSSVYSFALVSLTAGVLFSGERRSSLLTSPWLPLCVGSMAALGMATATSDSILLVLLGYGMVFGFANGMGYAFALRTASSAAPHHRGAAMAIVTACYAGGATVASLFLERLIELRGSSVALLTLGGCALGAGATATVLLGFSQQHDLQLTDDVGHDGPQRDRYAMIWRVWMAYGLSVLAGLMTLAHAAEIIENVAGSDEGRAIGTALVGLGSGVGGLCVAVVADRAPPRATLIILTLISSTLLLLLASTPEQSLTIGLLAGVGATYGAIIAVYPNFVTQLFGSQNYPRCYGRVFTAWGLAGVVGPVLGGAVFDVANSYRYSLIAASGCALLSSALTARIRPSLSRKPSLL